MAQNRIRHIKVMPSSNGLAEQAVQVFKDAMRKLAATPAHVEIKLTQFLFQYRITPHATTGIAPAQLLMHQRPKLHLDLLHLVLLIGFIVINKNARRETMMPMPSHDVFRLMILSWYVTLGKNLNG